MIRKLLQILILCGLSCLAHAQQNATPVNGDTRLVTFEFDEDQTYLILTRPKSVTHIQLRPEERVISLFSGDSAGFTIESSANRNHIVIRPKYEGLTASLTLITTERVYPIMLRSTAQEGGKWYQRVTWNFQNMILEDQPELTVSKSLGSTKVQQDEMLSGQSVVSLEKISTNYQIDGDADFKPTNVFDDGIRTFIRFPEGLQNIPAVFAVFEGEAKLVNFNIDQKYVVIQGVHPELLLKMGKTTVKINKVIKRGFWG